VSNSIPSELSNASKDCLFVYKRKYFWKDAGLQQQRKKKCKCERRKKKKREQNSFNVILHKHHYSKKIYFKNFCPTFVYYFAFIVNFFDSKYQFHERSTSSFYAQRSQKYKETLGGNSQKFLRKFLSFFLTLKCFYKVVINRK